jgi:ABC-type microcin C transport system permease subunit YejE
MNKKETPILDFIDGFITNSESILFAIPYLFLTSIGTVVKLMFLTLTAVLSLNQWIKLKDLWSKEFLKKNLGNPWNCVLAAILLIISGTIL